MNIRYKLTSQDLTTYNGFQWTLNEWKETVGGWELCSPGWLHCYSHPLIAILLNRIHANIHNPRLFKCEVEGKTLDDRGLKEGWTRMRLIEEMQIPRVSQNQSIAFAILCALEVSQNQCFIEWANNWLSGKNRNIESAHKVYADSHIYSTDINAAYAAYVTDYGSCYTCGSSSYTAKAAKYSIFWGDKKNIKINLIELAEKAMQYT